MEGLRKSANEFTVEELDRELIARGAPISEEKRFYFPAGEGHEERDDIMKEVKQLYDSSAPLNEALCHISTWELAKVLMEKTGRKIIDIIRGIWGDDNRIDFYQIKDEHIKRNADCVAAICFENNLKYSNTGFYKLETVNYGITYNLCEFEPFRDQPIGKGRLCTGFLVGDDLIATAGHCACEKNVARLCFIFGYRMTSLSTPVTQIPEQDVYKGVRIIERAYDREKESDWVLIQLDRKVKGRPAAALSKEGIYPNQPLYVLGHPCGLPLKCGKGAKVHHADMTLFAADLDIYMGNSGSPVFDGKTHEVVGIVVHGDTRDFRYVGNGWLSIIYSKQEIVSRGPRCTRVSEFIDIVDKL